jgi:hypothetical protein
MLEDVPPQSKRPELTTEFAKWFNEVDPKTILPPASHRRTVLDLMRYQVTRAISTRGLQIAGGEVEARVVIDSVTGDMIAELNTVLVAGRRRQLAGEERVRYPDGPWQWFKLRYFDNRLLRWFLRRRPVKMFEIRVPTRIELIRVCPHLPIGKAAEKGNHIEFVTEADPYRL